MDLQTRTLIEQMDLSGGVGSAVQLLIDELDRLEKLRDEIDLKIEKMGFAKDILSELIAKHAGDGETAYSVSLSRRKKSGDKKSSRINQTAEVLARSKQILISEGRPLDRMELLDKITESGFMIATADPPKFIGRTLWESPDFFHVKNKGYWLTGRESDLQGG